MVSTSTSGVCSQSNSTKTLFVSQLQGGKPASENCSELLHMNSKMEDTWSSDGTPSIQNESFTHDERQFLLL